MSTRECKAHPLIPRSWVFIYLFSVSDLIIDDLMLHSGLPPFASASFHFSCPSHHIPSLFLAVCIFCSSRVALPMTEPLNNTEKRKHTHTHKESILSWVGWLVGWLALHCCVHPFLVIFSSSLGLLQYPPNKYPCIFHRTIET